MVRVGVNMKIYKAVKFEILLAVEVEKDDALEIIEQKALVELQRFVTLEDVTDLITDISDCNLQL